MATLPGAWRYRVSTLSGLPGVIYRVNETASFVFYLCVSVTLQNSLNTAVPKIHLYVAGMLSNQPTSIMSRFWGSHYPSSQSTAYAWSKTLGHCISRRHVCRPIPPGPLLLELVWNTFTNLLANLIPRWKVELEAWWLHDLIQQHINATI